MAPRPTAGRTASSPASGKYSGPEDWETKGFPEELRFKENGPNEAT